MKGERRARSVRREFLPSGSGPGFAKGPGFARGPGFGNAKGAGFARASATASGEGSASLTPEPRVRRTNTKSCTWSRKPIISNKLKQALIFTFEVALEKTSSL